MLQFDQLLQSGTNPLQDLFFLVTTRLPHVSGTQWNLRKYLNVKLLTDSIKYNLIVRTDCGT